MNKIKELINANKIIVIGVTGGVGCGKSCVLDFLVEKYGAIVYKSDDIGHTVMEPGTNAYKDIINYFGSEILNADQSINRKTLGSIVFEDEDKLQFLNSIIHPAVEEFIINDIVREYTNQRHRLFVIEAALLIESGYGNFCNELWYIYADTDTRIKRLMNSRNYTKEKCLSIMNNQLSEEEFRSNCDFVVDNKNDFDNTKIQIEKHMNFCYNITID